MLFNLPDVILLDMDNTIYEYAPCHANALIKVESYLKDKINMETSVFHKRYKIARQEIHSRLLNTASSHNRLLYFQHLLELSGYGMKISLAVKLNEIYWETFIDNIRILEGVSEFLEYAKKLGIPIAFVTDLTADIQFRKIVRLNLENTIDALVTSEEAGKDKPAIAIFELALKKINCNTQTIWMVGDSISKDVAGGKSIGAVTFLRSHDNNRDIATKGTVKPDYVFMSFYELIDILEESKNIC